MSATQREIAETLLDDFSLFDDWEDRYKYIIELGGSLDGLDEVHKTAENRVQGCTSNVWMIAETAAETAIITFKADSDSQIVRGLISILLMFFSERSISEVIEFEVAPVFQEMALHQHLSRSRSNGLNSMILRMKDLAGSLVG